MKPNLLVHFVVPILCVSLFLKCPSLCSAPNILLANLLIAKILRAGFGEILEVLVKDILVIIGKSILLVFSKGILLAFGTPTLRVVARALAGLLLRLADDDPAFLEVLLLFEVYLSVALFGL